MAVHLAVCWCLIPGCWSARTPWRVTVATEPLVSGTYLQRCGTPTAGKAPADGMVTGMATKKVTVTLDEAQLDQVRALVEVGTAASVSGFVQHAVAVALDDVAGWGAMLAEALRATGGPLSDGERAWADEVLGTGTQSAA